MKQKLIKIFQKFFQLLRQEQHSYRINWKKSILKKLSLWPFSRGGSHLLIMLIKCWMITIETYFRRHKCNIWLYFDLL